MQKEKRHPWVNWPTDCLNLPLTLLFFNGQFVLHLLLILLHLLPYRRISQIGCHPVQCHHSNYHSHPWVGGERPEELLDSFGLLLGISVFPPLCPTTRRRLPLIVLLLLHADNSKSIRYYCPPRLSHCCAYHGGLHEGIMSWTTKTTSTSSVWLERDWMVL